VKHQPESYVSDVGRVGLDPATNGSAPQRNTAETNMAGHQYRSPFSLDESASAYPLIGLWAHLRSRNMLPYRAFSDTHGDFDRHGFSESWRYVATTIRDRRAYLLCEDDPFNDSSSEIVGAPIAVRQHAMD
jgi:hypothetical protein